MDATDTFLDCGEGERVRLSFADGVTLTGTLMDIEEASGGYLGHDEYVEGYRVATLESDGERYAVEMPLAPDGRPGDIAVIDSRAAFEGGETDDANRTVLGTVVGIESLDPV